MAWRTFEWAESPGTACNLEPQVAATKFMDGYEQRQPTGLNAVREIHDLAFNNIDSSIADDIEAFIKPDMGYGTFLWTPKGRSTPLVVKCMTFSRVLGDKPNMESIRLRFEQVFEPI